MRYTPLVCQPRVTPRPITRSCQHQARNLSHGWAIPLMPSMTASMSLEGGVGKIWHHLPRRVVCGYSIQCRRNGLFSTLLKAPRIPILAHIMPLLQQPILYTRRSASLNHASTHCRSTHKLTVRWSSLSTSSHCLNTDYKSAPAGTLFIHGGCPASGRLSDLWGFDIASRTWSPYPDAPGPARGGAALAYAKHRLYRFGGYNGVEQLGGQIDHLDVSALVERSGKKDLPLGTRSGIWETTTAPAEIARSVAGLHSITTGQGRNYLLLLLGEKNASTKGHEGAGQFWDDVWSFQIEPEAMTAASLKNAARRLVNAETGDGSWAKVDIPESSKEEGQLAHPGPRGWFASAQGGDIGNDSIVLWGGLTSDNERAGDGWILTVES